MEMNEKYSLDFSDPENLYENPTSPFRMERTLTPEGRLCSIIEDHFMMTLYQRLDYRHSMAFKLAYMFCSYAQEAGADMDKFEALVRRKTEQPEQSERNSR